MASRRLGAFSRRERVGWDARSAPVSGKGPQASLNAGSARRGTRRERLLIVALLGAGPVSWLNEHFSVLNGSLASLGGLHEASRLHLLLGFARRTDGFLGTKGTTILQGVSRRN